MTKAIFTLLLRGPLPPGGASRGPRRPAPRVAENTGEIARDALVAEIGEAAALPCHDLRTQIIVEGERPEELRRVFEILRGKLDARAAERLGNGGRGVREHRHVRGHRFD